MPPAPGQERLPTSTKIVFSLGDHTIGFSITALSVLYFYFLTEHVGMRPSLAGSVLLVGRAVDAFTDPLMGRLSDLTRWKAGRRRPYFLIAALPFGLTFASLWFDYPLESQASKFAFYTLLYVLYSLSSTLLAVPYAALMPELTLDYQERTSVSTYRAVASALATLLAASGYPLLAAAFGGGPRGFALAGIVAGIWIAWPWFAVYRVTFERPEFRRPAQLGFRSGVRTMMRHAAYRHLLAIYLCSRITMDLVSALFLFFFQHWLRRPQDFPITMGALILTTIASLFLWLRLSHRFDKAQLFIAGTAWWLVIQALLFLVTPDSPPWVVIALGALAGIGYSAADMIPFAMLGDVIDEDELATGERREGIYAGFFTFLRKLGGATAVFLAGHVLDLAGFQEGGGEQTPFVVSTVRMLTVIAPASFLVLAALFAFRYPITRRRHAEILLAIAERKTGRR